MKTYLLFLVCLLCVQALSGQFFKLIPEDQERLYFQTDNRIFAAEIASVDSSESVELIHLEGLTERYHTTGCYKNTAPDILGNNIRIEASGDHIIQMDASGDLKAIIRTQALVDEFWTCFEYNGETVTATCISTAPGSVNGMQELIKTIRFSNNFCDLVISQTHGIISTPAWNLLYEDEKELYSQIVTCLDRKWDNNLIEKLNTPFGDLASDLQIGDELHIKESDRQFNILRERFTKATFLAKSFDEENNNYHLAFRQEVKYWEEIGSQFYEMEYIDTSVTTIGRHAPNDSAMLNYPVPLNRIFDSGETGEIFNYSFLNERLILKQTEYSLEFSASKNCFPILSYGFPFPEYIEGLAGPYFVNIIQFPFERTLKYYKKGTEEWGEPFTFTVSTFEK
ncbi:MAG: hypothetical protein IPI60_07765 [Saprospiraceae bacterium]|nr:hypothetical protein [Saprospiraceae bacterium]